MKNSKFLILVLIFLSLVAIFIAREQLIESYTIYKAKNITKNFIRELLLEDYEKAITYMHFFEISDQSLLGSQIQAAKVNSINRLKKMSLDGIKITGFSELSVWANDFYPQASLILHILINNESKDIHVSVHYANFSKGLKITNISSLGKEGVKIEDYINGRFGR